MDSEIILRTAGLTKEFSGFVAVKNVNLEVRRGTIHALIGPNGAGKTTCFYIGVMLLAAGPGTTIKARVNGDDEEAAMAALVSLFESGL